MRIRRSIAVVAACAAAMTLSGCTWSGPPAAGFCVPRITVEPVIARAGETITISSSDVCDAAPPDGGWVIAVAPVGDLPAVVRSVVPDDLDGAFRVRVALPDDFPSGDAWAGIDDWDYSGCDDNASCASPTASFTVER